MQNQPHRRWLDQFADWAIKVLITTAVALLWTMNSKLETIELRSKQTDIKISQAQTEFESRIAQLQNKITILESEMVKWDILKRMELNLSSLVSAGRGNEAMAVVAAILRAEREAREKK